MTTPRICENCGALYTRRGRATQCEKCSPPRGRKETAPQGVSRDNDMAYAVEFIEGVLFTAGIGLQSVDRHDAAVILRSSQTLPKQVARVMAQDAAIADRLIVVARKGALYYLGFTVLATVVAPILSHHHIGPGAWAMSDDSVDTILGGIGEAIARMAADETAADDAGGVDVSDLDLSFLTEGAA
jgi:hypothetical protein